MHACISCGSAAETTKPSTEYRLVFSCKKCGSYDIYQAPQIRLNRNKSERKKFCNALKKAKAANRMLLVTVESGSGLKFKHGEVNA